MRTALYSFLTSLALVAGPAAAQAPRPLTTGRIVRHSAVLDQLLAPSAQLEVISSGHGHVEGPMWVPDSSMLLFSDTPSRTIYRWRAADAKRSKFLEYSGYTGRMPYSKEPGSNGLALDGRGNLLLCEHGDRRLASLPIGQQSGKRTVVDAYQGKRFNSPNGRTLYVSNADSLRPLILAYEVGKNGKLSKPRPFFDMTSLPRTRFKEVPDGLKVDLAGNVYAAGFGGLLIISAQGQLLGTIDPGEPVSNCAWGDDGHSLYVMASSLVLRVKTLAQGVPGR
ncbi:MAG: hypothetical protein EOO63_05455 [Hymenobacter sp.]|nr:MAG: hypothetical protein EOO63_05455 [Hymenobacter sp.]